MLEAPLIATTLRKFPRVVFVAALFAAICGCADQDHSNRTVAAKWRNMEAAFGGCDYKKALAIAREIEELRPYDAVVVGNVGTALWAVGDFVEAKKQFQKGLKLTAKDGYMHWMLGLTHFMLGELGDAEKQATLAATDENFGRQGRELLRTLSRVRAGTGSGDAPSDDNKSVDPELERAIESAPLILRGMQ